MALGVCVCLWVFFYPVFCLLVFKISHRVTVDVMDAVGLTDPLKCLHCVCLCVFLACVYL